MAKHTRTAVTTPTMASSSRKSEPSPPTPDTNASSSSDRIDQATLYGPSVVSSTNENSIPLPITSSGAPGSTVKAGPSSEGVALAMATPANEVATSPLATSNKSVDSSSQAGLPAAQLSNTCKEQITIPSNLPLNLSSTLQTLSTQLATAQLSPADLQRVLKSLKAGMSIVSKATSRGEFELFPKLPLELKLKIWRYAAWSPQVIAIKDDFNPRHMALCGGNARCPLVRVSKEARAEVLKIKIDINSNANGRIKGAPKIWVNLAVDTIWVMNWNGSTGTSSNSNSTWNKWTRCSFAHLKKLAIFDFLFLDFFKIDVESRPDNLQLEELFMLTGAQDAVLDADTIQLINPRQGHRIAAIQFSSKNPEMDYGSLEDARRFWRMKARVTQNEIEVVKAGSHSMFDTRTNETGPLATIFSQPPYDYLRDLSEWVIPKIQCRELALFDNAAM